MERQEVRCNLCRGSAADPVLPFDGTAIVRCRECGLLYINPRPTDGRLAEIYNDSYFRCAEGPYYRDYFAERSWRTAEFRRLLRKIGRYEPPGRLLDVGAAAGYLLDAARDAGWKTVGVELSERASAFAREELGLDVRTGHLPEVELEGGAFDVVTMIDVIEHTVDPRTNLLAAHRCLRDGGLLVISTPNIDSLGFRIFGRGFVFIAPEVHLWYFGPRTLGRLLEETGFRMVRIEYPYFDTPYFNRRELWNLVKRLAQRTWYGGHHVIPSAPMRGNLMLVFARKFVRGPAGGAADHSAAAPGTHPEPRRA